MPSMITISLVLMFFGMIKSRKQQMVVVDKRVRMLSEVINNIRAVKLFAFESFFGERVSDLRRQEIDRLRANGLNRSFMFSTITLVPTMGIVCK